jgi:hypothetical protein
MRFFSILIITLFLFSTHSMSHAQETMKDTVYLMNGEIVTTTILDTSFYGVKILRPNSDPAKKREVIIEGERVFSYKINGVEKLVYFQDTTIGNEFSIEETRQFMVGERDAQKGFHSRLWPVGNVVLGAASAGIMNNILAFIPPFAYAAATLIPKVTIRHSTVSNMSYLRSDTYILGYERVARKRRTLQSFVGGVIGLGVGFAARSIVNSTSK